MERIAARLGMRPKDKDKTTTGTGKGKNFQAVGTSADSKGLPVDMKDLMEKLEQIDKNLRYGQEDRQELKREIKNNKKESLDNYFTMPRSTKERLQQIAEKNEKTGKDCEKLIEKGEEVMRKHYESVNGKLWSMAKKMGTMSEERAKSSCAIQSKLNALLRNFIFFSCSFYTFLNFFFFIFFW